MKPRTLQDPIVVGLAISNTNGNIKSNSRSKTKKVNPTIIYSILYFIGGSFLGKKPHSKIDDFSLSGLYLNI